MSDCMVHVFGAVISCERTRGEVVELFAHECHLGSDHALGSAWSDESNVRSSDCMGCENHSMSCSVFSCFEHDHTTTDRVFGRLSASNCNVAVVVDVATAFAWVDSHSA